MNELLSPSLLRASHNISEGWRGWTKKLEPHHGAALQLYLYIVASRHGMMHPS